VQLPSPRDDPRLIFRLIDTSGDGHISREELADYCAAFAGVSVDAALAALGRRWAHFDENGDGTLCPLEFQLAVVPVLAELHARESESAQIPSLADEPDNWFTYWDDDNSGLLEIGELLRALCKTFTSLSTAELTGILEAIWPLLDHDGSNALDIDEFRAEDGLLDMLRANLPV